MSQPLQDGSRPGLRRDPSRSPDHCRQGTSGRRVPVGAGRRAASAVARAAVAALVLVAGPDALFAQEPASCEPTVTLRGVPNRMLPHAFYNQALESIPSLYPEHEMLAGRRVGRIGDVEYALVAYRESPGASVRIEGLGVHRASERSWYVASACGSDDWVQGLVRTLEVLGGLGGEPGRISQPEPGTQD